MESTAGDGAGAAAGAPAAATPLSLLAVEPDKALLKLSKKDLL